MAYLAGKRIGRGEIENLKQRTQAFERYIKKREEELGGLSGFILPGGDEIASLFHLLRTICRRAERRVVGVVLTEKEKGVVLSYLNRLSDLFFILAREYNRGEELLT